MFGRKATPPWAARARSSCQRRAVASHLVMNGVVLETVAKPIITPSTLHPPTSRVLVIDCHQLVFDAQEQKPCRQTTRRSAHSVCY